MQYVFFNTYDAYYFDICHYVGDMSFCIIWFGELQLCKSDVIFVRISQYMSGVSDYHNMLVRCHFAGYRRPWVTAVVVVVVLWLVGMVVVLITFFLVWRQAKKENTTSECNFQQNVCSSSCECSV